LLWDYVAADKGMSFHAPGLSLQTLASAVEIAGRCRVECARILARHGITTPVEYPDYSTKDKAQAVVKAFVENNPPLLIRRPK
jgi:nitrite reductase (cytochrome c-552)